MCDFKTEINVDFKIKLVWEIKLNLKSLFQKLYKRWFLKSIWFWKPLWFQFWNHTWNQFNFKIKAEIKSILKSSSNLISKLILIWFYNFKFPRYGLGPQRQSSTPMDYLAQCPWFKNWLQSRSSMNNLENFAEIRRTPTSGVFNLYALLNCSEETVV